jgi:hypothetical protein
MIDVKLFQLNKSIYYLKMMTKYFWKHRVIENLFLYKTKILEIKKAALLTEL